MRTDRSHGIPGFDANEWSVFQHTLGNNQVRFQKHLQKLQKELTTGELKPEIAEPYNAGR